MTPDDTVRRALAASGRLRAALNLGNPVLASSRTASERPAGVTIDLARACAAELGVEVELLCFEAAAPAAAALAAGQADIGFMAIDPQRAQTLAFTDAYVEIEGCYLVREGSPLRANEEVDRAGHRVLIGRGSAYGLFLARHLQHAALVEVPTSEEVPAALLADPALDVAAGVRQQLETEARRLGGVRLLPGRFMVIRQAMALPRERGEPARAWLEDFIARHRASGFVREALARHDIEGATALP